MTAAQASGRVLGGVVRTFSPTLMRSVNIIASAVALAGVGAANAAADSGEQALPCVLNIGQAQQAGTVTATFDTAIPDGLVVDAGAVVALSPITGTMTLPEEFTTALRNADITSISGFSGFGITVIGPLVTSTGVTVSFDATPVPTSGPFAPLITFSEHEGLRTEEPGMYQVGSSSFAFELSGGGVPSESRIVCQTPGNSLIFIDEYQVATPTSTPTLSPTESPTVGTPSSTARPTPVRPEIVQTDFADSQGRRALLLFVGGLAAVGASALGAIRLHMRKPPRRH